MSFELPPYPYDRLDPMKAIAADHPGGIVDLSIGTPFDDPPAAAIAALADSATERSYPPSIGTVAYREAAADWYRRRVGVTLDPAAEVAACIGTKEFVASTPAYLHLRRPDRDTVLYPAVAYPTYAMGAQLAGLRAVPVPVDEHWRIDVGRIEPADMARALMLWVNTPGNPAGGLDDLGAIAQWGRSHDIPVFSDECYIEFTWDGPLRSILEHGSDGVVAVHSLSKRSNLAGARAGFYAGDSALVHWLRELRKHAGNMVPGPVQAAAVAAWADDAHVDAQRTIYHDRLTALIEIFAGIGYRASMPGGGFYLWIEADGANAWDLVELLARKGGALVSPGEFYGAAGAGHVRVAAVQPLERLAVLADRLR